MANRSKSERDIHIIVAAGLFATLTRDAQEIGDMLDTSERSIHRWAKEPLWDEVLETLDYDGERNFRVRSARDPQREDTESFEAAKAAYNEARESGVPEHKRISTVEKQTGIPYGKLRYWVRKYGWDKL